MPFNKLKPLLTNKTNLLLKNIPLNKDLGKLPRLEFKFKDF